MDKLLMLNKYLFLSELQANTGDFFASVPQLRRVEGTLHNHAD